MLEPTARVTAIIVVLEAAFFLAKGNLGLSADLIAELSATKYGYNLSVARNIAEQNANSYVGIVLVILSAVIQMLALSSIEGLGSPRIDFMIIGTSIVISVIFFLLAYLIARLKANRIYRRAESILNSKAQ